MNNKNRLTKSNVNSLKNVEIYVDKIAFFIRHILNSFFCGKVGC